MCLKVIVHVLFEISQSLLLFSNDSVINGGLFDVLLDVFLEFLFNSNVDKVESDWLRLIHECVNFSLLKEFVQFFLILLFVIVVGDVKLIKPLNFFFSFLFRKLINYYYLAAITISNNTAAILISIFRAASFTSTFAIKNLSFTNIISITAAVFLRIFGATSSISTFAIND